MTIEIDPQTLEWTKFTLEKMGEPVRMIVFTNTPCVLCDATVEIVKKIAEISSKVTVEVIDRSKDTNTASIYGIDKYPAILLRGKEDNRARFFGIPAGFEFGVLVSDLVTASIGPVDLGEDVKLTLQQLTKQVHIEVFTLPTCPRCPIVSKMVHDFAYSSKNITADIIDAMEFRELAAANKVLEVPKVIVNGNEVGEIASQREFAEFLIKV
ncbi:MAG: thioredoxin family protein [Candidatus Methanomethylicus sp.]|nr:thioredoxin family protein [Candidatus Methanomethylicus sp.]